MTDHQIIFLKLWVNKLAVICGKEDEVAGWSRSLQLRGIELQDELKDELFLIVGERRFK